MKSRMSVQAEKVEFLHDDPELTIVRVTGTFGERSGDEYREFGPLDVRVEWWDNCAEVPRIYSAGVEGLKYGDGDQYLSDDDEDHQDLLVAIEDEARDALHRSPPKPELPEPETPPDLSDLHARMAGTDPFLSLQSDADALTRELQLVIDNTEGPYSWSRSAAVAAIDANTSPPCGDFSTGCGRCPEHGTCTKRLESLQKVKVTGAVTELEGQLREGAEASMLEAADSLDELARAVLTKAIYLIDFRAIARDLVDEAIDDDDHLVPATDSD